jgi:small-conductance mechanosensitive channel
MPVLLFLRRIPREAWIILAALLALWAWGNHRAGQGRAAERAKLMPIIEQERGNRELLEAQIKIQNEAMEALRADERKARKAVQKAAQAGDKVRGRVEPRKDAVRAVEASGGPVPYAVRDMWRAM